MPGMSRSARTQSRVPEGVPTGGQFATSRRSETGRSTLLEPAGSAAPSAPPGMRPIAGGDEAGLSWALTHGPRGTVNGYVRLPDGHPWEGRDSFEISTGEGCPAYVTCARGGWVGFDSASGEQAAHTQARRLAHAVREAHLHDSPAGEADAPADPLAGAPIAPGQIREGVAGSEDPRVQAGEFFNTVIVDGDTFHRRRPGVYPGTPYYTRVQADRPLTADEVERMSQLLGYEYARSVRGERLGSPTQDTPCSFILHTDVTKSASDDVGVALEEFESNLPTIMREGSPVRKTNRAGAGTKGTRLIDPLTDPPAFHLYYDDVID